MRSLAVVAFMVLCLDAIAFAQNQEGQSSSNGTTADGDTADSGPCLYVVGSSETLSAVGMKFGVSVEDILAVNRDLVDSDEFIAPDRLLRIPLEADMCERVLTGRRTATTTHRGRGVNYGGIGAAFASLAVAGGVLACVYKKKHRRSEEEVDGVDEKSRAGHKGRPTGTGFSLSDDINEKMRSQQAHAAFVAVTVVPQWSPGPQNGTGFASV